MRRVYEDRKDRKHLHRRGHGGSLAIRHFLLAAARVVRQRRPQAWYPTVADAMRGTNPVRAAEALSEK